MQSYTEIADSQTLTNSRVLLLGNDKTVMSCNSGTAFPTADVQIGMLCYRTDLSKLYQLMSTGPDVWKLIFDLSKTATDKEYVDAGLATKQNTVTGAASTVVSSNLTASRVVVSDASGKIIASANITTTELDYLNGVTSNIQTQLNGKLGVSATAVNATKWNGANKTVSTAAPSGGVDGDIWLQY